MLIEWTMAAFLLQSAPEAPKPGRIEGRVVSATTGEPLARARVSLLQSGGQEAPYLVASRADGRFVFESVRPGAYLLAAEKVGYLRATFGSRSPASAGRALKLAPGEELRGLEVKLTPQSILSGRVVDEDGEPLPYATVAALRRGFGEGGRRLIPVRQAQANELGEFRAAQLPAGRYYLLAASRGWERPGTLRPPGDRLETYAPTFYPNAAEETSATPIELAAGQELSGYEIRLRRTPLFRVSGRLVTAGLSEAPGGYRIALAPRARGLALGPGLFGGSAMAKRDTFEILNVAPGSYILTVVSGERAAAPLARQPVEVANRDLEGLVVTLSPPVEVRGTVRVEGQVKAELRSVRVALVAAGDPLFAAPRASPQADGSLRLANVARESYHVQVTGVPEGMYVKAIHMAGQDVLGRAADLGVPGAHLEIVLAPGAGQIEGMVYGDSGQAEPACTVTLVPHPPQPFRADLYKNTDCDAEGRFRFTSVAPGAYRLYAWDGLEPGAERDPEFLRQHESGATSLEMPVNGREQARLKCITATLR